MGDVAAWVVIIKEVFHISLIIFKKSQKVSIISGIFIKLLIREEKKPVINEKKSPIFQKAAPIHQKTFPITSQM